MRALVSLLALGCVGVSLLPGSQTVSLAFVFAAIALAGGAVGTYIVGEFGSPSFKRRGRSRTIDMTRYSRPIPVDHVDPVRSPRVDREPHTRTA